jgi:streptogramin lyase
VNALTGEVVPAANTSSFIERMTSESELAFEELFTPSALSGAVERLAKTTVESAHLTDGVNSALLRVDDKTKSWRSLEDPAGGASSTSGLRIDLYRVTD